ncbi:sulfotransferase [Methylococcus capsulatus]|jgi:hypothetical protein|uniref:sulfotransferase n=1 Tax=Methylococcus capsulatus TaxID=414 RepID=UPI001C530740|nr:sulfotransferase [Methylococcus capsulatus]QXP87012.1 sulfotransferase [Methylococcus capsulatus]QXP93308.1 sulfotransferase [Methylococcus capsulatus]UQN11994.1 sulfotransferase [Methylococcus capsulatus]
MTHRIHIVGCSPRSGTTLLNELMVTCFEIGGFAEHEQSIYKPYDYRDEILLTKYPLQTTVVAPFLAVDPDLWVIYLLRDPRDAISSRSHRKDTQRYWSNLGLWRELHGAATKLMSHPRFITIRYEDLVTAPDAVQRELMARLPFLELRHPFSEFHRHARPSRDSLDALGSLRPIDSGSIGNWRRHKPHLVAQMAKYGDLSKLLIELGYEKDDSWLAELEGVSPDDSGSLVLPERPWYWHLGKRMDLYWRAAVYWLTRQPALTPTLYQLRTRRRQRKSAR